MVDLGKNLSKESFDRCRQVTGSVDGVARISDAAARILPGYQQSAARAAR
jgi:hypothetical protein